jgi:serine/threonine-protein kinase PpkA
MAIPGYRILRKIRQGGMSTVYLAIQKSVDREVAIKVMSPGLSKDPSYGSRFYREAKIVGQLSHPNIVSIYDVGNFKHYNYIAMDYLPGAPLQDKLARGIETREALTIVKQMASALGYAHSKGYVHRDIKPDNILFRQDGSAVLCDFGIAKTAKPDIKMTQAGSVLGTPHYMSPEQAQGHTLDGRADLYSLGVVFYEMLTGQPPYPGEDLISIAVKHISAPIPKLPAHHKVFQELVDKCMAKKPSARYQTGKELIEAVESVENKFADNDPANLTQTHSTTVQVFSLAGALFSTLSSALVLSIKRILGVKIGFSSKTIQLTKQQYEAMDNFILDDDNAEFADQKIFSDHGPIPITEELEVKHTKKSFRFLLMLCGLAVLAYFVAPYFSESNKLLIDEALVKEETLPVIETLTADENGENNVINSTDNNTDPVSSELTVYQLRINTKPTSAEVRILNIKPVFEQGMSLEPGSYHVEVNEKDYFRKRIWLNIIDQNVVKTIHLKPTRRLLAAGTIVIDKLKNGTEAPTMVILPLETVNIKSEAYSLSLSTPIAISTSEITFADYDNFARSTKQPLPDDFGWGRGNKPVVGISFDDALAYAKWLSKQSGQHYRLPTSTEWEFAARAGTATQYWWGEGKSKKKANCRRGCDSKWSKLFSSSTAPVKSFPANPYGVYDMAGNVAEWLACINLNNDARCTEVVVAGGSHQDRYQDISSNARKVVKTEATKAIGIRLVLEL